ncbi:MAG: site-specific DNA-methyltransferase [Armatimonadota bacterium]|nr:site-specific DNA-methyltransferase [Armatimonadota bacterium]MDR7444066.1 site-specific DNA-methyltransferase [Armatimonadota bacterium]MDR7613515.1 site-specific DNA-methyltransferase [Armatimonadota bacterium]
MRTPYIYSRGRCTARLYEGDSLSMPELRDEEIALTVTSPPYWNSIDYDRHAQDPGQWYRTRSYGHEDYESFLNWLVRAFGEVYRVTKPGGYLCVVVGTVLFQGRHYPVPQDLVSRLSRSGWEFEQDIIWHKTTAGVRRAGVFIQKPYPGYYHPNIMTEYILVFRKPGPPIYRERTESERRNARVPVTDVFTRDVANNVWHIAPVPPGTLDHPCPFPEEIPYRLIQLYSYPDEVVLDPFLGSGQVAKVALHLGRHAVGYDIVPQYVTYAYGRLSEPLRVRRKQLVVEFRAVGVFSPVGGGWSGRGEAPADAQLELRTSHAHPMDPRS